MKIQRQYSNYFGINKKTTITVYNSVDNEHIRNTTEKLNEKIKQEKLYGDERRRQGLKTKKHLLSSMTDEEYDDLLVNYLKREKQERIKKKILGCKLK